MNRFHGFFRKTESLTDIPGIFSALLRRYHKHLRIADHGSPHRRVLYNVVLLDYCQYVAAELAHLPVVFLDHPRPSLGIQ